MLSALVGIGIHLVALYVFALVLFHIYRKDLTWQKLYTLEINFVFVSVNFDKYVKLAVWLHSVIA